MDRRRVGVNVIYGETQDGSIREVAVTDDGKLKIDSNVSVGDVELNVGDTKTKLIKTISIDLETERDGSFISLKFDGLAVAINTGVFKLTIDDNEMTIDKCLYMDVTSNGFSIANEIQTGKSAELWFFRKEV